jgi:hypothetical protein
MTPNRTNTRGNIEHVALRAPRNRPGIGICVPRALEIRSRFLNLVHKNQFSRATPVGAPRQGHQRAPGSGHAGSGLPQKNYREPIIASAVGGTSNHDKLTDQCDFGRLRGARPVQTAPHDVPQYCQPSHFPVVCLFANWRIGNAPMFVRQFHAPWHGSKNVVQGSRKALSNNHSSKACAMPGSEPERTGSLRNPDFEAHDLPCPSHLSLPPPSRKISAKTPCKFVEQTPLQNHPQQQWRAEGGATNIEILGSEFGPRTPSSCIGLALLCILVGLTPREFDSRTVW